MTERAYPIGKTVAILGYNDDGINYAKELRSQGINVVIGLRLIDPQWTQAEKDGFQVMNLWDAVLVSDIIQVW
jgi:ketol-acid reductoisomerase